jgi:2-polyprenyl-6-methoxyphenol hydroxylase-like FAD-dependent oxidoreductase
MLDVIVIGGGTVGLIAGLLLKRLGLSALVLERRSGLNYHPRALGLGPRTLEIMRCLGLAEELEARALTHGHGRWWVPVKQLKGTDFSQIPPRPLPSDDIHGRLTPGRSLLCTQDITDRLLLEAGSPVQFSTQVASLTQTEEGVEADGMRARYAILAEGAGGRLRSTLGAAGGSDSPGVGGISMTGPGRHGEPVLNIFFRADVSPLGLRGDEFNSVLIEGKGLIFAINGRDRFVLHHACGQESPDAFPAERCRELVYDALGTRDVEVEVLSVLPWRVGALVADRFRCGRVFLAGDAAHVVPPNGGFGLNTGIADAHNLAWKLAAVVRGEAGEGLLDTYDRERRPIAQFVMEQAVLRLLHPALHFDRSRIAERTALGIADDLVIHLGLRCGAEALPPSLLDLEEDLRGQVGSRVPHVWVSSGVSTLDLVGLRWTLLAPPGNEEWVDAARDLGLQTHTCPVNWERPLLVRPDGYVAWPCEGAPSQLRGVLARLLRLDSRG